MPNQPDPRVATGISEANAGHQGLDQRSHLNRRRLLAAATAAGAGAALPLITAPAASATGRTTRLGLPFPEDGEAAGPAEIRALAERLDEITAPIDERPSPAAETITRSVGTEEHGPFAWSVGSNTFGGQINPVMHLGYNARVAGSPINADQPQAFYSVEADYVEGEKRTVELYAQINSAPADGSGVSVRPFFFQAQRDAQTHATLLTRATVAGDPFGVEHTDGTAIANFAKGHFTLEGAEGKATVLDIRSADGQPSELRLGAGSTPYAVILGTEGQYPKVANMTVGGLRVAQFYSSPIGVPGAAFAVGAHDNSAAGLFAVGGSHIDVKALVARGRAGQRANLFEAQRSDGASLVSVSPTGNLIVKGNFEHSGSRIGFFGSPATTRPSPYDVTNPNPLRSIDVTRSELGEIRRVLGALITDLQAYGLLAVA